MAHGIIEHTANLEYRFQPGALNESIADVFGAMIDDDDWLIGEDIVKEAYFPSGALRNLEDPHNGDHANGWQLKRTWMNLPSCLRMKTTAACI